MGLLVSVAIGLLVGALAARILPGEARGGILGDLLVGAVGGALGAAVDGLLFHAGLAQPSAVLLAWGLIGSVVLLNLVRRIGST